MGVSIDGKKVALSFKEELLNLIKERVARGLNAPCIASVLVGDDKGSLFYLKNQIRVCEELGVVFKGFTMDKDSTEEVIIEKIRELNEEDSIHGIILQLPLPKNLDEEKIINSISHLKDVDGLTDINAGKFYKGERCFVPCTAHGVLELIKSTGINISGKNAVVLGRSTIVGKPVAQLLVNEDATVTICHSKTQDIRKICKEADIVVAAVGIPRFVTEDFIKEGAVIIDVGTSVVDGKMTGDVDYENVIHKAGFLTPVPGGVGSMTPIMLIKNTCEVLK